MRQFRLFLVVLVVMAVGGAGLVSAQDDLAAALEVLNPGVEVQRVNTNNWVPVRMESIVGVGDTIRTDETGQARITFFEDGTYVDLEPETTYHIIEFSGDGENFTLSVEILAGITLQQFARLLDAGSSYQVSTPGMAMTVRGTTFDVRVEDDGRSSLLTREGQVEASDAGTSAVVAPGYGVRSEIGAALSDVVEADSFAALDAALDGCAGGMATNADVMLNVRQGPGTDYLRIGALDASEITLLMGTDSGGEWYRIPFNGGFGWVSAALVTVNLGDSCAGLRVFNTAFAEDSEQFSGIGSSAFADVVVVLTSPNAETVNLRSGPGQDFPAIAGLAGGDEVYALGRTPDADWLQIITADGTLGWMASSLVVADFDLATLSVLPAGGLDNIVVEAPAEDETEAPAEAPADDAAEAGEEAPAPDEP